MVHHIIMTRLPTLQRRIARYLAGSDIELTNDELAIGIVGMVINYLDEQLIKQTELTIEYPNFHSRRANRAKICLVKKLE